MAINDILNRVKDGWDRVVGSFLHGEREEYYTSEPAYYPQQDEGANYSAGYPQEYPEEYAYQQNAYQPPQAPSYETASPYAGSYAQIQMGEEPANQQQESYYGQDPYQGQPVADNMVAFPGVAMDQVMTQGMGNMQAQIIQLKDRETCKVVIEALRNSAAVLINMENIAGDSEKQRCVDMLGGAAYTLNCQISKISGKGVYLISPVGVQVEMDEATRRLNGLARAATAPSAGEGRPLYASQRPPAYRDNEYAYQEPMAVGYDQSPYAAPYGGNQGQDGYQPSTLGAGAWPPAYRR